MAYSVKRIKTKIKTKSSKYLRCGAKTITFLFWASLYMVVMKMTLFKSSVPTPVKDWSMEPDNYTKWLLQGPVLGNDDSDLDDKGMEWSEPENSTIQELEKRATRTREVCRKKRLSSQPINSKEFFVDHEHNIVWCNIFKAASSSWLFNFNILGGYSKKYLARARHTPLMLARDKFPRPSEDELKDAASTPGVVSLLIVREPFVRLLSAYRDKLENITPPYYRKLARAIVAKYRKRATKTLGKIKSFGPTFYEFVAYLIEKHNVKDEDFTFDEHWAPYYQFCSPCALNFSVIAKVETLARDSAYVIHELGLGHLLGPKVRDRRTRLRTVMNKSKDGRNTTALLKHYFSQLDQKMLDDLFKIYEIDFEMFGYDKKVYNKYVRNCLVFLKIIINVSP